MNEDTPQVPQKQGVDETSAAWAAGIIDASGRFSVTVTPEGRYDVDVVVSMPNVSVYEQVKVLTRLVTMFGGRIITQNANEATALYTWRLPGHLLRKMLPAFARFMVLQNEQCSITTELFERTGREADDDFEMTPEELDARADLHFAMETVNRRRYG